MGSLRVTIVLRAVAFSYLSIFPFLQARSLPPCARCTIKATGLQVTWRRRRRRRHEHTSGPIPSLVDENGRASVSVATVWTSQSCPDRVRSRPPIRHRKRPAPAAAAAAAIAATPPVIFTDASKTRFCENKCNKWQASKEVHASKGLHGLLLWLITQKWQTRPHPDTLFWFKRRPPFF